MIIRLMFVHCFLELQNRLKMNYGFLNFVPWPFMDEGTTLLEKLHVRNQTAASDYIRLIAISRLMLVNIANIQASWLTVGQQIGQICLHSGANDFGSIMIEENVVRAAGVSFRMSAHEIDRLITDAGFTPARRRNDYTLIAERALQSVYE